MNGPTAASPPPRPPSHQGPRHPSMGPIMPSGGPLQPPSSAASGGAVPAGPQGYGNPTTMQPGPGPGPQQQFLQQPQMMMPGLGQMPPALQQHIASLPVHVQHQFMQQQLQQHQQRQQQQQQQQSHDQQQHGQPPQPLPQQPFTGQQPTAQMLAHMNNIINGQQGQPGFRAANMAAVAQAQAQAQAQGKAFSLDDVSEALALGHAPVCFWDETKTERIALLTMRAEGTTCTS